MPSAQVSTILPSISQSKLAPAPYDLDPLRLSTMDKEKFNFQKKVYVSNYRSAKKLPMHSISRSLNVSDARSLDAAALKNRAQDKSNFLYKGSESFQVMSQK